jgi:2-pyrone-4,6-dicarboxylate lactonase
VAALLTDPQNLRGVAVLNPDAKGFADAGTDAGTDAAIDTATDAEIERLHAAGVRGLRCNIVDVAQGKGQLPRAALMALAQRIAPWGWHLEFLMHANEFPDLADTLAALPVPSVLGHFGYVPTRCTVQDAGFQSLLSLVREGRTWVKLTGPYRISGDAGLAHTLAAATPAAATPAAAQRYADVRPFSDALLRANPAQLLWGTDWPHVMVKGAMPHDADLCSMLGDWVADLRLRQQILVDNPERLYGFEPLANLSQA